MPTDPAFFLMATHTAQIMAPPAVDSAGKRGELVLTVPSTPCLPLDYVRAEVAQRLGLEAPARLRQTFLDGRLTVPRGAVLLLDGEEKRYPIQASEPWDWAADGTPYTHLIVLAPEA